MDDQTKPICNSTRSHLGLQLEQPTRYIESPRDVESGAYPIVDDEDYDKGQEADNEEEEEDNEQDEDAIADPNPPDTQTLQPKEESKVPPLYQVEPGCTPMSCYASIITFIIMCIFIVWLLVYSIPDNAKHRDIDEVINPTLNPAALKPRPTTPANYLVRGCEKYEKSKGTG